MKILILGGAGMIGQKLLNLILQKKEIKSEKFWKDYHQGMKASRWDNLDTKGKLKNVFWTSIGLLLVFWLLSLIGIGP